MRRLTEKELDARINKFLFRKYAQFPELRQPATQNWQAAEAQGAYKEPSIRWSLQLS